MTVPRCCLRLVHRWRHTHAHSSVVMEARLLWAMLSYNHTQSDDKLYRRPTCDFMEFPGSGGSKQMRCN
eukprot:4902958-Amphidinium_carterae.2